MTEAEFETLYKDLRKDMIRQAKRTLKSYTDAEDIVQTTFVDLISMGIERLDPNQNVRAYVYCKLYWNMHHFLNDIATRDPVISIPSEDGDEEDLAGLDHPLARIPPSTAARIDVMEALDRLPAQERAIVTAVAILGYNYTEVGESLWSDMSSWQQRTKAAKLYKQGVVSLRHHLSAYQLVSGTTPEGG